MVYRYLQESGEALLQPLLLPFRRAAVILTFSEYTLHPGFQHTAFSFAHESNIHKTELDPNTVPPGALVTFVQRGMQYLEMEANLDIQVRFAGGIGRSMHLDGAAGGMPPNAPIIHLSIPIVARGIAGE